MNNQSDSTAANKTDSNVFKETFNATVFGDDFIPGEHINASFKDKRTSTKSQSEIDRIIFILRHWDTGVNETKKNLFRKENSEGYGLAKMYEVESYFLNGQTETQYRLCRKLSNDPESRPTNRTGSLIVPAEGVFDAIEFHHEALKHGKQARTWLNVKERYQNITQKQVQAFIDLCPTCFAGRSNTTSKNVKGASKPIISDSFRDRFQVDLVSYNKDPAVDHNNVIMLYIITIKDHCTGHIWLRPIRQKEAKLVARELKILFYEIGFPLIFHTDNGTEFMAEVYRLIKAAPITYSVLGRPRQPSDQGSVERGNRDIRGAISHAITADFNRTGVKKTWLDVLPEVQASLNQSSSFARRGLTPYRHLFGMDYGCPLDISHAEFASLRTPEDLCRIVNKEEFTEKLKKIGYDFPRMLEQKKSPSKKILPLKRKSGSLSIENDNSSTKSPIPEASLLGRIELEGVSRTLSDCNLQQFRFVVTSLKCEQCIHKHTDRFVLLSIGEKKYYDFIVDNQQRWLEIEFLILFGVLVAHAAHRPDILICDSSHGLKPLGDGFIDPEMFVSDSPHNNDTMSSLKEKILEADGHLKTVVAVVLSEGHYAVMSFCLESKSICIYDGLHKNTDKTWGSHRKDIVTRMGFGDDLVNNSTWKMTLIHSIGDTGVQLKQHDSFNCGPIACMVLWYLFVPDEASIIWKSMEIGDFRSQIVKKMLAIIENGYKDIFHALPAKKSSGDPRKEDAVGGDCKKLSKGSPDKSNTPEDPRKEDDIGGNGQRLSKGSPDKSNAAGGDGKKLSMASPDNSRTDETDRTMITRDQDRFRCDRARQITSTHQRHKMVRYRDQTITTVPGDTILIHCHRRDRRGSQTRMQVVGIVIRVFQAGSVHAITEAGIVADTTKKGSPPYAISFSMYSTVGSVRPIVHPVLVGIRDKILANEINAETPSFNRVSITALHSKIYGDIATPHPTEGVGSITITEEHNRLLITKFPIIPGLETSANRFTHPFSNTTTQHELNPVKVNIQEQGQLDDEQTSNYMTRIALLLFIDVYNTEQIRSVYGREYT